MGVRRACSRVQANCDSGNVEGDVLNTNEYVEQPIADGDSLQQQFNEPNV